MNKKLKSEKSLITRCKNDITAFEKLYKKYVKDVYRYVYVVVKDKEVAEDITSQTFLIALEKVEIFKWRGISIKYWFLKIARNLVSRQISKPKDISLDEKYEIKDLDRMLIEDVVIEEELKNKLKELIFRLDDTTREIISLRIWEDMKFREISEFLGMNQATVITKFTRGVKKLQKILESDRKGKRLYSVNLVLIIVGIKCLKRIPEFLPKKEFIRNLAKQITNKINLIVRRNKMKGIKKLFKTSRNIKIVSFLIALITFGGVSLFVLLIYRNDDIQPSDTTEEQEETTEGEASGGADTEDTPADESETTDTIESEPSDTSTTDTTEELQITDLYEGWTPIKLDTCHLSLYYPSEWYADDYEYGDYCTRISILETIPATEPGNLPLLITIGVFLSEYNTPEEHYENLKQYPSVKVITGTKKVDGEDRFYVEYTDEYSYTSYHIYYEVNGVYYAVVWQGTDIEENQDSIDKLIESIKIK